MTITLNGRPIEFEGSVADLVEAHHGRELRGIAVALNDQVVARGDWDTSSVSAGDRIEIVTAVQGG